VARALKVWLAFKQVGRSGFTKMIADDIAIARRMHERVSANPELEPLASGLSITTFRYVPADLDRSLSAVEREAYLNELNTTLLTRLQEQGEIYLSNGVIDGKFALRACIVNFRTSLADADAVAEIAAREGRRLVEERR
jgi:aromatic-L-amino-acid/L-tryptophan decarboxylase